MLNPDPRSPESTRSDRHGSDVHPGSEPAEQRGELPESVRRQTFVVIAAYNEGPVLEEVVREVRRRYPHVVVVDDGSTDDTLTVARRATPHALHHLINRGQGAALQTGIAHALRQGARYVVTFDADGQHLATDIDPLVTPVASGQVEIVLGSRFLGRAVDIPRHRELLLKAGVLFTRVTSRARVTDTHNGLRCFSRAAALRLEITMDRMAHASEVIDQVARSGLPYCEVPVEIHYSERSLAKGQSSRHAFRVVLDYLLGRLMR